MPLCQRQSVIAGFKFSGFPLWTWYLKKTLSESLKIYHKCPVGLEDELIWSLRFNLLGGGEEWMFRCSVWPDEFQTRTHFFCAQHVNYKHALITWQAAHVSLLLTSSLMDPSSSSPEWALICLLFVFMGCNHVTAWLILMSAYIFPASCLHFRTSLWSITANRWVHLRYNSYKYTLFLLHNRFSPTWLLMSSYMLSDVVSSCALYFVFVQQNIYLYTFCLSCHPFLVCVCVRVFVVFACDKLLFEPFWIFSVSVLGIFRVCVSVSFHSWVTARIIQTNLCILKIPIAL